MKKKFLAMALAVVMVLAVVPVAGASSTTMADPSIGSTDYSAYPKGQCTWYAWGRYKQLCGVELPRDLGDAKDWYTNAKARGLPTGTTPKVGAIACWNAGNGFDEGHVAVVEQVLADGSIRVSQYNRGVSYGGGKKFGGCDDNNKRKWIAGYLEKVPGNGFPPKPSGYIYLQGSTAPVKTTITFDLVTPSSFTVGTDATLDGSITAANSKVSSVKAEIINASTGAVALTANTSGFGVWTYGPIKGSKLDNDLNLGKLTAGTYFVRYTATTKDGTSGSGQTSNFTVNPVSCNGNHTRGEYLGSAEEHPHWVYWKCAICGEKYTEWGVETKDSCEICNPPAPSEPDCSNGHTWSTWEIVDEADCENDGKRQRICSVCGKQEEKTIPATGHDWQLESDGYYRCTQCNATDYTREPESPTTGMDNFKTVQFYYSWLFDDVDLNAWYYDNVSTAYELGLMKGTGSGTFSPGNNVTLAETITLAARIHKIYLTNSDSFASYDGGNWYDPYVDYARENNIINTYYTYSRPATREEFVHILAKALPDYELTNTAGFISFADSSRITYLSDVRLLSGAGVINGVQENGQVYFKPDNAITRAEVAAIIGRMVMPHTRVGSIPAPPSEQSVSVDSDITGIYANESGSYIIEFEEQGNVCTWYQDGVYLYGIYDKEGDGWLLFVIGDGTYFDHFQLYMEKVDDETIMMVNEDGESELFTKY